MRCMSCQQSCTQCTVRDPNFKYIVRCTNIIKYWNIFLLIISVSPMDANGYFTLLMADSIIKYEDLHDILPRNFWEAMSYFLSRRNHKLYLDRKRKTKNG